MKKNNRNLINKSFSAAPRFVTPVESKTTETSNEELYASVAEAVSRSEEVAKGSLEIRQTLLKLLAPLVIFGVLAALAWGGYVLLYKETGPSYLAPSKANHRSQISQLPSPGKFDKQISDVDLSPVQAEIVYSFNPDTFQVYAEKNITAQAEIASITKLMSALVVMDTYDLDSTVEISNDPQVVAEIDWGLGLEVGDKIQARDLLHAMLVSSYNDAAISFAQEYPSGGYSGFIQAMNDKATSLGMENTHFANPMGYDDDLNYSTASDLRKLVVVYLQNETLKEISAQSASNIEIRKADGSTKKVTIYTTNKLLGEISTARGLKTGYTEDAGLCLIGYFDAGGTDKVITIVLNASDRFEDSRKLLENIQSSYSADW